MTFINVSGQRVTRVNADNIARLIVVRPTANFGRYAGRLQETRA